MAPPHMFKGIPEEFTRQKGTRGVPMRPNAPDAHGFSDEVVKTMNQTRKFPLSLLDGVTQREVVVRYLNYHASGEVPDGFNIADILFGAIGQIPSEDSDSPEKVIWDKSDYGEDGKEVICRAKLTSRQSSTSETEITTVVIGSTLGELAKVINEAPSHPNVTERVDIAGAPGSGGTVPPPAPATELRSYTTQNQTDMQATFKKLMDAWDPSRVQTRDVIKLRRFSGFMALVLLRGCIKDLKQMSAACSKIPFEKNLSTITGWMSTDNYCPPCHRALNGPIIDLQKGTPAVSSIFIKLCNLWKIANNPESPSSYTQKFLAAGVLTHTQENGMGLISLVTVATSYFRFTWDNLGKLTFFDQTKESWLRVARYMNDYQKEASPELCTPWARIINDSYFRDYSCGDNLFLCGILGCVAEAVQGGNGIWSAIWAASNSQRLVEPRRIGNNLVQKYSHKVKAANAFTPEAAALLGDKEGIYSDPPTDQARQLINNLDDV